MGFEIGYANVHTLNNSTIQNIFWASLAYENSFADVIMNGGVYDHWIVMVLIESFSTVFIKKRNDLALLSTIKFFFFAFYHHCSH